MIATEGLIDFSERSKQLFAYVLTGRDRPKDYQEGEKCEWLDPLQGYELFYILMTLTGSGGSEKKYTKMKRLFTGPLWNGSGKEKDQANSAPIKFRRKMNAIYPDICPVKEDKRP